MWTTTHSSQGSAVAVHLPGSAFLFTSFFILAQRLRHRVVQDYCSLPGSFPEPTRRNWGADTGIGPHHLCMEQTLMEMLARAARSARRRCSLS